jgi:N6-adenosine-specific RNA methylase IME4
MRDWKRRFVKMTEKPICPWCMKRTVIHYLRTSKLEPIGYWCQNCNKPVDPVKRSDPIIFHMDIRDFLASHRKPYDLILSDPPWKYNIPLVQKDRNIENHYETMEISEICDLPISKITNKRAVLFLWTPNSKINDALKVMEAWGFQYNTKLTWVKTARNGQIRMGLGNNVRNTSEDLLIGKKGDFPMPKIKFPSTFNALQTDHSRKPSRSYEIIENMYPDASRIEGFARYVYPGWTGVGNESEQLPENVYDLEKKMYTNSNLKRIQIEDQVIRR